MDKLTQGYGTDMIQIPAMDRSQAVWNLRSQMYGNDGVITFMSSLRSETLLTDGVTKVQIPLLSNDQNRAPFITERRLSQNDTFTILGLSVHIGRTVQAGATETEAEHAAMTLHSFPNPVVFANNDLEPIYNGGLQMVVDNTVFIEYIAGRDFYRVGTSQQGVGSSAVSNAPVQADEWQFMQYGIKTVKPTLELSGLCKLNFYLDMFTPVDLSGGIGENYYLVTQVFGFLNSGARSSYDAWMKALITDRSKYQGQIPGTPMFQRALMGSGG
jgi:hypothetical protein